MSLYPALNSNAMLSCPVLSCIPLYPVSPPFTVSLTRFEVLLSILKSNHLVTVFRNPSLILSAVVNDGVQALSSTHLPKPPNLRQWKL